MKRLITFVITMLVGASLAFAQTGGGSTNASTAHKGGKAATKTSKAHKGGKKSKKGSTNTTTPPPK